MTLDKKIGKVIMDIEYIIGSECYNPNSYDGLNDMEGCAFRYPINIPNNGGDYSKFKNNMGFLIDDSNNTDFYQHTPDTIKKMKYKFGSNELYIGLGIINALEYLENRYGLDFNKLEASVKDEDDDNI